MAKKALIIGNEDLELEYKLEDDTLDIITD